MANQRKRNRLLHLLFPERRYSAVSMALNHVSPVIEQEPFGGRGLWSHSRLPSALNVNVRDLLHLRNSEGRAVVSTVKFNHIWLFGFIFFFLTLVKFKLIVWGYISGLGLTILFNNVCSQREFLD